MLFLKIALIIAAAVFLISFVVTFVLLIITCRRGREDEHTDEEALFGRRRARYGDAVAAGCAWFAAQSWEDVYVTSWDRLRLHGLWRAARDARRTVILVHGYRSTAAVDFCGISEYYAHAGFNILMLDQRAHGKSEGRRIGFGTKECWDILAWAKFVEKKAPGDIYLHGVSMGGATVLMACGLDLPARVKGVVADCAFTTPKAVLAHQMTRQYHLPQFPFVQAGTLAGLLLQGRAFFGSTLDAVRSSHLPLLIISGEEDRSVPAWMSKAIYEAAAGEKRLLLVSNARHAVSYLEDQAAYSAALDDFYAEK